jgi:predicted MFS family arabinose efflux permease
LTATAWLVVSGSALMALAGISVFVISGSWLDDAFGVSTGGIGLVAMGLGAVELLASSTIAAFADRIGKVRSTVAGLLTLGIGLVIIVSAGDATVVGVVGLLVFLLGFEYGFVTSLSLTSEAMPDARGATLAISNAVGTLARGGGTILSGVLYGAFGIGGTVALSGCAAAASLSCYLISRRTARLPQGS